MQERRAERLHKRLLLLCQPERVGGIDSREVFVPELIFFALDQHRALFVIDAVEHYMIVHQKFGVPFYYLCLELELYYRYGLVHLCPEGAVVLRQAYMVRVAQAEAFAWVRTVCLHCKDGQRTHVYAVAVFYTVEICVLCRNGKHRCYARKRPCRRAHPLDVVIAPLYIDAVVIYERIKDYVGSRAAVKYISYYVQPPYSELLDKLRNVHDERVGLTELYDAAYRFVIVALLVAAVIGWGVDKLVYRVAERARQKLAYRGARIF